METNLEENRHELLTSEPKIRRTCPEEWLGQGEQEGAKKVWGI
jgi:hypothetical protein